MDWVANTKGDGDGYDILSFAEDGSELLIEVKTTNGGKSVPFLLTPHELEVWRKESSQFRLFRIYWFSGDLHFYRLSGPPDRGISLTTALWEARPA